MAKDLFRQKFDFEKPALQTLAGSQTFLNDICSTFTWIRSRGISRCSLKIEEKLIVFLLDFSTSLQDLATFMRNCGLNLV